MAIIAHLSPPMAENATRNSGSASVDVSPSSISLAMGAGVQIAPLVWSEVDSRPPPFNTASVVRIFEGRALDVEMATIIECDDGLFTLLSRPSFGRHESLERAQEAAQSDFENRLRTVLNYAPNSLLINQSEKDLIVTGLSYAAEANRAGAKELLAKVEGLSNKA
jgi:hypothetical protein